jgi:cysteine-rich repeat protein
MRTVTNATLMLALGFASGCLIDSGNEANSTIVSARLSGAIFTTLADGSRVNANIYAAKTDVYLDGGPGDGAPQNAAALPDDDYYFQVTDPSGRVLLSTDAITCRRFTVSAGIITSVAASGACAHATSIDIDHNAITVQLMPYADTPNPGGEYKAWVTRVGEYDANATRFHGFVPSESKTDNFKIRAVTENHYCGDGVVDAGEECDSTEHCDATCHIIVTPESYCGDGHLDDGEQCDDGNVVDGDGCSASCTTEVSPPPPCCGDGHLDDGEQCDDGNVADGDGCSATCTTEVPPAPTCYCGDGHVDDGEACDDGNVINGDGCSASCTIETPPVCK